MSTPDDDSLARIRARRLKATRLHLDLKTAKAGSVHTKVKYDTYVQHERGERDLTRDAAAHYAEKYSVPEEWLLWGRNPPEWAAPEFGAVSDESVTNDNQLRAWRENAQMSADDLADRVGASVSMVEGWENGSYELSEKWLRKLAVAFDTTPGSILDLDPRTAPSDLLTLWRDTAAQQREARRRLRELRNAAA